MKKIINLFALTVLLAASAQASLITITLDNPNQTGAPGETLSFYGIITNPDVNPDDAPIYLNSTSFNFSLTDATDDSGDNFLANVPFSLASGESSEDIDLFDITLGYPGSLPYGTYAGIYGLLGGRDGGDFSAQEVLGQADFSVTTAPEPGSVTLLGAGLIFLVCLQRRSTWQRG